MNDELLLRLPAQRPHGGVAFRLSRALGCAMTLPCSSTRKTKPVWPILAFVMVVLTSLMLVPAASTPSTLSSRQIGTERMAAGWPVVRLMTTSWPTCRPSMACLK